LAKRYSKGGLATADGKNVVPCKWVAKIGSNTVVPSVPTATTYNFIKDKRRLVGSQRRKI
jgi:hypothetical protein